MNDYIMFNFVILSEYQHLWDSGSRNSFLIDLILYLENSDVWHCIMLNIKVFFCLFVNED